ncbi:hypothetical protein CBS101457_001313 [Exobasidium rhododendri]|nr:hypothetical protein CBS101457_001313 [Exobasidium rhododendri]
MEKNAALSMPGWRPWKRHVIAFDVLLDQKYPGAGTRDDPYHVSWITSDPQNPIRMPMHEKVWTTFLISFATMATNICSSAYTGSASSIRADFGVSTTLVTLGLSLFVLGFACGPLFWAPLSEVFGRRHLFIISYASLAMWSAVSIASPNYASFMVFRFLAGAFGSSSLTNSGGTISDLFNAKQRGTAMCFSAAAPFMGPAIGPIIGGFISMRGGWKWTIAFLAFLNGTLALIGALFFAETYAPVLLRQRARHLSRSTGKVYISSTDVGKDVRLSTLLKRCIGRPWMLLYYEPIVSLLGLYIGFVYATLYSFFEAFPIVFQQVRGWNPGVGGLPFLGILVGMLIGLSYIIFVANKKYVRRLEDDPALQPEVRLLPSLIGAPLFVVGLAGFAATDSPTIQWIVPVIFASFIGMAIVLIYVSVQNYLVDSYMVFAASAIAANSILRSILGAAFPLFTPFMYEPGPAGSCPKESCGIHVGPAIAGAIALLFMPFPYLFLRRGEQIRKRCRYSAEALQLSEKLARGVDAK